VRKETKTAIILVSLVLFLGLPFVAPLPLAEGAADMFGALSLETIALGSESAYACRTPTLLVIRDRDEWERAWNLHQGKEASQHQLPDIDFEAFSVMALFAGRSAAVEGLQIVRLGRGKGDGLTVYAVEVEPGLGCTGPEARKNPFHIVRVPAVKNHIIPSLEIEILSRHCPR
jgi:hypothetical protein